MGELGIQPFDQQLADISGLSGQGEQGELAGRLRPLATADVDEEDLGLEQPGQSTELLGLGDGQALVAAEGELAAQHSGAGGAGFEHGGGVQQHGLQGYLAHIAAEEALLLLYLDVGGNEHQIRAGDLLAVSTFSSPMAPWVSTLILSPSLSAAFAAPRRPCRCGLCRWGRR